MGTRANLTVAREAVGSDKDIENSGLGSGEPDESFPGVDVCLRALFHDDPAVVEDAYWYLVPIAGDCVDRLIKALEGSSGVGRLFLVELLGESESEAGYTRLQTLMWSTNPEDSQVAQESLWSHFGDRGRASVRRYQEWGGRFAGHLGLEDANEVPSEVLDEVPERRCEATTSSIRIVAHNVEWTVARKESEKAEPAALEPQPTGVYCTVEFGVGEQRHRAYIVNENGESCRFLNDLVERLSDDDPTILFTTGTGRGAAEIRVVRLTVSMGLALCAAAIATASGTLDDVDLVELSLLDRVVEISAWFDGTAWNAALQRSWRDGTRRE